MRLYKVPVHKKKLLIVSIGDIQFTGTDEDTVGGCSVGYLRGYLTKMNEVAKAFGAQLAWIGTGDYVDLISPSNRERYRANGLYTPAKRCISAMVSDTVQELYEILAETMRGKDIVTLCMGHHWFIYDDSLELPYNTTDHHLAALFGMAKRDDRGVCKGMGIADFSFGNKRRYRVAFQHGEGNGQSLAYGLNKLDKIAGGWETVDAFIMGHTHKPGAVKKARLYIDGDEILHRDIRLVTSGSFLKGWKIGEVLYPEEKQLSPIALGGCAILVEEDPDQPSGLSTMTLEY